MITSKHDKAMMETARIWAQESYCRRNRVGAVLAKDGRILATGYNGTIAGHENICEEIIPSDDKNDPICPKCDGRGEMPIYFGPYSSFDKCTYCGGTGHVKILDRTNEFTLHAEQNVITFCAKNGIPTYGTSLYITLSPCKQCAKLIAQSGIEEVIYDEKYRDTEGIKFLKKCVVKVREYQES
jgi:dCMP deaminase